MKSALEAIRTQGVKGLAHITGGGITENLPRALPQELDGEVDLSAWTAASVFPGGCAKSAGIETAEMLRTFNCGLGLIVVASPDKAGLVIDAFGEEGEKSMRIGTLVKGQWRSQGALHRNAEALMARARGRPC